MDLLRYGGNITVEGRSSLQVLPFDVRSGLKEIVEGLETGAALQIAE